MLAQYVSMAVLLLSIAIRLTKSGKSLALIAKSNKKWVGDLLITGFLGNLYISETSLHSHLLTDDLKSKEHSIGSSIFLS